MCQFPRSINFEIKLLIVFFLDMFSISLLIDVVKFEVSNMNVCTIMESNDATFFGDIFSMKDLLSSSSERSQTTPEHFVPLEHYE